MAEIAVHVRLVAPPGRRDDLVAALQPFLDGAAGEPGTLAYALHHDLDDGDAIWFYTLFADAEALETHRRNEAELMGTYPGVPELLAETPREVRGAVVSMTSRSAT